MNILFLLIPMALMLGGLFLYSFFWAVSDGQLDDLETPAHRILDHKDELN
jgi:cbb3-type cytochrome oxidase maturation protein